MEKEEKKKKKKKNRILFLFRRIWEAIKRIFKMKISIYHRKGIHLFTGAQGIGKTLEVNHLINQIDSSKYFFITSIDEFYQENVYYYDISKMFKGNKQIARLPTVDYKGRKLYALIGEEINRMFNRRLNRTKEYNDMFIGLVEFLVTFRHQGIPRIWFIGQKFDLQDSQLQLNVKYWHNIIFNKMKPNYNYYKNENLFIFAPVKLYIENFIRGQNDEFIQEENIDEIPISYNDLITYNTHGLKGDYDNLPCLMSEAQFAALKKKCE